MDKNSICISNGHQIGVDNGAAYGGLLEADLTIQIGKRASEIIRKHNIPVLEVPDNLSLPGTISWINARKDQIKFALEVHINAGGGTGVEGWYYQNSGVSKQLCQYIVDALSAETGLRIRGVFDETTNRHGRLGFVHDTIPLAGLIECGFIDGKPDYDMLKTKEGIEKFARGVARGSISYYGGKWNPSLLNASVPTPTPTSPSTPDKFEQFYQKYKDKYVEVEDDTNRNQCFDLAFAWVDELKIPRSSIRHLYAYEIYTNPTLYTARHFDRIPNDPNAKPQRGDIVVWNKAYNGTAGHVAIATGEGVAEGKDTDWFMAFQQNDPVGSKSTLKRYNYNSVLGWLKPKQTVSPVNIDDATYARAGREAERFIFGYKTEGTLTERLKKAQDVYRKYGIRK